MSCRMGCGLTSRLAAWELGSDCAQRCVTATTYTYAWSYDYMGSWWWSAMAVVLGDAHEDTVPLCSPAHENHAPGLTALVVLETTPAQRELNSFEVCTDWANLIA